MLGLDGTQVTGFLLGVAGWSYVSTEEGGGRDGARQAEDREVL